MNSVIFKPSSEPSFQSSNSVQQSTPLSNYKRDILRAFRMYRGLALAISLLVFVLLVAYALTRRPYYQTSALVYVQPMKARVVTDAADGSYDPFRYDSYIQQQIQTILRSDTLTSALKDAAKSAPHDLWTLPGETLQSAVSRLQKNIKVERETGSYQLSISLSGNNPRAITALVNAVVSNYIANERADELAQNDQQLQVLRQDRVRILDDLNDSTREQAQLSSSLGVADPAGSASSSSSSTSSSNPFDTQLAQLRSQLSDARAARAVADAQLASVSSKSGAPDPLDAAATEAYENDPGLSALKQTINQRRSLLATQMAGLTPKNPLYKQDQDELQRLDSSLDTMSEELRGKAAQQVLSKLQLEAARKEDVEARIAAELQRQTGIATGATPKLQRAASITAEVARLQARFTEVDNAINALELEHASSGLVHLLVKAENPPSPQTSKKWLILAAALPFGFACGLAFALLRHKLDHRIYLAEDVTTILTFPPMAVLPNNTEVDANVTDEFLLRLVAGLDQAHSTNAANTFLFSAISPTTNIAELVATLALKMDNLGYRTMIIKASAALHSPSRPADANFEEPVKWSEVQLAPLAEVRPAELRRGSLIAENLKKITQKVDLLFIEALPILSSAEAEFAARLADMTVLIAQSAKTTRKELDSSLSLIRRLHVPGVAAVLTGISLKYADEEFIAMVESVQKRRYDRKPRSKTTVSSAPKQSPLSIWTSEQTLTRDTETTVKP